MAETTNETTSRKLAVRYSGRIEQVGIYFKKFLRMFLYQSDWKVLPMSALIAGLVGMVMNASLFRTMEGTLMGAFALVMVCIWNGCFNSIQVICRERDVIKREHRSGMHISSYIASHKLYQAMLCLMQTAITLFVTSWVGVRYDLCKPLFSHFFIVEFGLSMFLITYASDMMALWISTLCRNTTTAMTIMPFVLMSEVERSADGPDHFQPRAGGDRGPGRHQQQASCLDLEQHPGHGKYGTERHVQCGPGAGFYRE